MTNTEIGTPGASEMRVPPSAQRGVKFRVLQHYWCFALVSSAVSWLCVDHLGMTGEIRSGKHSPTAGTPALLPAALMVDVVAVPASGSE